MTCSAYLTQHQLCRVLFLALPRPAQMDAHTLRCSCWHALLQVPLRVPRAHTHIQYDHVHWSSHARTHKKRVCMFAPIHVSASSSSNVCRFPLARPQVHPPTRAMGRDRERQRASASLFHWMVEVSFFPSPQHSTQPRFTDFSSSQPTRNALHRSCTIK